MDILNEISELSRQQCFYYNELNKKASWFLLASATMFSFGQSWFLMFLFGWLLVMGFYVTDIYCSMKNEYGKRLKIDFYNSPTKRIKFLKRCIEQDCCEADKEYYLMCLEEKCESHLRWRNFLKARRFIVAYLFHSLTLGVIGLNWYFM